EVRFCWSFIRVKVMKSYFVRSNSEPRAYGLWFVVLMICFSSILSFMALKNIRIFCLGFLCFMLFNLSTAWAQSAESRTAEGQTEIRPLVPSQSIPEEVWNRTFTLNYFDGRTEEV